MEALSFFFVFCFILSIGKVYFSERTVFTHQQFYQISHNTLQNYVNSTHLQNTPETRFQEN